MTSTKTREGGSGFFSGLRNSNNKNGNKDNSQMVKIKYHIMGQNDEYFEGHVICKDKMWVVAIYNCKDYFPTGEKYWEDTVYKEIITNPEDINIEIYYKEIDKKDAKDGENKNNKQTTMKLKNKEGKKSLSDEKYKNIKDMTQKCRGVIIGIQGYKTGITKFNVIGDHYEAKEYKKKK
ncbi:hypothetical protein BX661DRAFT_189035 [Kickxella alabastrina]|uniref:uncharacterized protein n=1 Tax=Kickxella alabastrina TaxID=61397 RepID=UPI00221E7687|nr:uncharacterized protein BX661DRAFT_189035 [Kickxella alabastrina]KAI7820606.1 hypothetical protein BX661DRAFT_189035 [Kickxella alabastrina]